MSGTPHEAQRPRLEPCPFCGGEAKAFFCEESGTYDVQCQQCGALPFLGKRRGPGCFKSMDDVIAAWNRRAGSTCEQRRTCRVDSSHVEQEMGDYSYLEVELSCGHAFTWDDGTPPDYCPYCGARIIREEAGDAD